MRPASPPGLREQAGSDEPLADVERPVQFTLEALHTLQRAISDTAGPAAADEVLFRVGRRWGESDAGLAGGPERSARARLEAGLVRLAELGLGRVTIQDFELDPRAGDCTIKGHVFDAVESRLRAGSGRRPEGPACGITVGYLTGLVAGITGLDMVSSPFRCAHACASPGCTFELRPAHKQQGPAAQRQPPSGSARFFLGALGARMGEGDISLDALVENTADGILLIDSENVIRYWSSGAEAMFRYTRAETVGRPIGFLLPADLQQSDELGAIGRLLEKEGSLSNYITRRVRKDGVERWVSLTRSVLHDSQGQAIGSTAIFRDITEQRRTERELNRARELALIGELAAQVAHQIKNPLAGMYATIQLLSRTAASDDANRETYDDLAREIRRLDNTVKDLLRFARPPAPRRAPLNLGEFLADVVESLLRLPDVQQHALRTDVPPSLVVAFDPALMLDVFENLILNAAQAIPGQGKIELRAHCAENEIVIDVCDNGPGLPAELIEQIFTPFFTTKSRGSGLGLSIAKKYVEAHGGSLRAENQAGGGARFRITLPLE